MNPDRDRATNRDQERERKRPDGAITGAPAGRFHSTISGGIRADFDRSSLIRSVSRRREAGEPGAPCTRRSARRLSGDGRNRRGIVLDDGHARLLSQEPENRSDIGPEGLRDGVIAQKAENLSHFRLTR